MSRYPSGKTGDRGDRTEFYVLKFMCPSCFLMVVVYAYFFPVLIRIHGSLSQCKLQVNFEKSKREDQELHAAADLPCHGSLRLLVRAIVSVSLGCALGTSMIPSCHVVFQRGCDIGPVVANWVALGRGSGRWGVEDGERVQQETATPWITLPHLNFRNF